MQFSDASASLARGVQEARSHISPVERDTIVLLAATALVNPAMNVLSLRAQPLARLIPLSS